MDLDRVIDELAVHASAEGLRFCSDDGTASPLFTGAVRVLVQFTNTSGEVVVLSRSIPNPTTYRVAADAAAGERGDVEYEFGGTELYGEDEPPEFGDKPNESLFVILRPGETYVTSTVAGLLVRAKDAPEIPRSVAIGSKHGVQLELTTWPYPVVNHVQREELRERWLSTGNLVVGKAVTNYFEVEIPAEAKLGTCNSSIWRAESWPE